MPLSTNVQERVTFEDGRLSSVMELQRFFAKAVPKGRRWREKQGGSSGGEGALMALELLSFQFFR